MPFIFQLFLSVFILPAPVAPESAITTNVEAMATSDFLVGKHNYYTDTAFTEIPENMAYRSKMFLLNEVYQSYFKMYTAAKKDGVQLKIISAARTFEEQSWIWEDKWKKNKIKYPVESDLSAYIMQYSAMPGTSRHHWGTEVDLNSTSDSYFATATGKKVYDWLQLHASQYGFCQTYDSKGMSRSTGYNEEKWHWSYFPISDQFMKKYAQKVNYSHIQGFLGDNTAKELDVIANYVLSISASCGK